MGIDDLRKILNGRALRKALSDSVVQVASTADSYQSEGVDFGEDPIKSPFARQMWRLTADRRERIFEMIVMSKIDWPSICVTEDLIEESQRYLFVREDKFDEAYSRFVESIIGMTDCARRSRPIPFITGSFGSPMDLCELLLWNNETHFIGIAGAMRASESRVAASMLPETFAQELRLYFHIEAFCSFRALDKLCAEMKCVLYSLFRACQLLDQQQTLQDGAEVLTDLTTQTLVGTVPLIAARQGNLIGTFSLIPEMLAAYFLRAGKKDSIDRRIRNAIHLLVEADQQEHVAVALALSVTAIEALLGQKSDGNISNLLAENVAVMLEPDLNRRNAAVNWVKGLYNTRSRVLHGEKLETLPRQVESARSLAAAVLKGMVERRLFMHRVSDTSEKPRDLFAEMREGKFRKGQLAGVNESVARLLWSEDNLSRDET